MENREPGTTYAVFWLYKVAPEWRRLEESLRARQRQQFARALEEHTSTLFLRGVYSLVGLRHDADLLLWLHGNDLGAVQDLAVTLRHTALGAYLETVYAYTGLAPESRYAPEHRPAFVQGIPPRTYLSIYPFTKTHEWYLLPFDRRRELMLEHGRLGQKHSAVPDARNNDAAPTGSVLTNTVSSFGLGDQEFVVAFESDDAAALEKMVEDLRAAEVRSYTAADTPIFLARRKEPRAALADLG